MKSFSILFAAAFAASTSAVAVPESSSAVLVDVGFKLVEHVSADTPTTIHDVDIAKRDLDMEKRQSMTVTVWMDDNFQGRREVFTLNANVCYNLVNGWDNQISSCHVQDRHGCYFYDGTGCNPNGAWLRISNPLREPSFSTYGFNDRASSLLCYSTG